MRAEKGVCALVADESPVLDADGKTKECKKDGDCGGATEFCHFKRVVTGEWSTDGKGPKEIDQCTYNERGEPASCVLGYHCGFRSSEQGDAFTRLMANGATVWNVSPLGCQGKFCEEKIWQNKWLIRSLARGDKNMDGAVDEMDYDCLFFPSEGTQYSHPRRVPDAPSNDGVWLGTSPSSDVDANGDLECGIWAPDGDSQEKALIDNLQAVWSFIPLPGGKPLAPRPRKISPLQKAIGLTAFTEWTYNH